MQALLPLAPGHYYHIFNRGINRENVFREERNYGYFLQLYAKHVEPVTETFAYCLMPNHFHLLVRIKNLAGLGDLPGLGSAAPASKHFSDLFNAYAKAINKAYGRTGSLFQKRFSRIEVASDRYFLALVHYIHYNPQKHGFVTDFRSYPHSSYHSLLSDKPTRLQRAAVLDWFGSAAGFEEFHRSVPDAAPIAQLLENDE